MHLFSRKSSRENALQRIYTDAYQSSLQGILKESSFEFRESLELWRHTLAKITSGMASLDGSPPKTGQEKSLLASITDIERQCHERIASLEMRLSKARASVGGSHRKVSGERSQPKPSQQTQQIPPGSYQGSQISQTNQTSQAGQTSQTNQTGQNTPLVTSQPVLQSPQIPQTQGSSSPVFDFGEQFTTMPKVSEMPYGMYSKKPAVPPARPQNVSHVPAPQAASTLTPRQFRQPRKPPPAEVQAQTAVLIQADAARKQQEQAQLEAQHQAQLQLQAQAQAQAQAQLQATQNAAKEAKAKADAQAAADAQTRAQQAADAQKAAQIPVQAYNMKQAYREQPHSYAPAPPQHSLLKTLRTTNPLKNRKGHSSNNSVGSNANHNAAPSPRASRDNLQPQRQAQQQPHPPQQQQQHPQQQQQQQSRPRPVSFSGFDGSYVSDSQPSSPVMEERPKIQPQTSGRSFQVVHEMVESNGRQIYRPRVVRTVGQNPSASRSNSSVNSSGSGNGSNGSSTGQKPGQKPAQKPVQRPPASSGPLSPEDEWDQMVQQKISELRGVDKDAAQKIVTEVVLKGDKVQWDDIAGLERAKASLKETVVYPFLRPDLFMGLREPVLGMLLFGPPGTGKTMLARAVANESKSTFFSISASSLTSKYMGESEKLVRALFQLAKALAPSIIFIDEIDSILTQRADSGEHEASRRIKNEFLVQWSDLQAAAAGKADDDAAVRRVLVLGATNLPWAIDEAARRRFVRRQYIPLPEPYTRQVHLLKLLSHQKHALSEAELIELVRLTDGYSGSDITALAKDAAMGPLRSLGDALLTTAPDQIRPMGMADFVESMRSIRPSVSPEGLRAFEQWADMYGSSGA